ncbi:TPA: hypothetical protein ACTXE5_001138 [Raoultella ornithinolytica]|uniref:hypothetical protein n=1 Tax=Klebsiella quasipneumoniae TaxID=1463165 RepID=UPI003D31EFD4
MTTDITELAKREKFEAWWEREYKHLESSKYTDTVPHIKYGFWAAYQAGGSELVEALEKAQTKNELVTGGIAVAEKLRERIAYLEKRLRGTEESLIASTDMVAELESRTVKLPGWFVKDAIAVYDRDEIEEALAAAGIKWEAE